MMIEHEAVRASTENARLRLAFARADATLVVLPLMTMVYRTSTPRVCP